jgi:hypothetical protein
MDEPLHCLVGIHERDDALRIVRERQARRQESRS